MFCESLKATSKTKAISNKATPLRCSHIPASPEAQTGLLRRLGLFRRLLRRTTRQEAAIALCLCAALLMGCTDSEANGAQEAQAETAIPADGATAKTSATAETVASFDPETSAQMLPVTAQVVLGGETIDLEVTRSVAEQAKGLMYRERLPSDRGMLFTFSPARPVQFWMKNVVIDLDMVFIYRGEIVGISTDVPPCRTVPCPTYGPGAGTTVSDVIELAGGRAEELGLEVGDVVEITPLPSETP